MRLLPAAVIEVHGASCRRCIWPIDRAGLQAVDGCKPVIVDAPDFFVMPSSVLQGLVETLAAALQATMAAPDDVTDQIRVRRKTLRARVGCYRNTCAELCSLFLNG